MDCRRVGRPREKSGAQAPNLHDLSWTNASSKQVSLPALRTDSRGLSV